MTGLPGAPKIRPEVAVVIPKNISRLKYVVLLALLGCSTSPYSTFPVTLPAAPGDMGGALTVFAAASLTEAFKELVPGPATEGQPRGFIPVRGCGTATGSWSGNVKRR